MTIERAREIKAECRRAIIELEREANTEAALPLLAVMDALDRYVMAVLPQAEVSRA